MKLRYMVEYALRDRIRAPRYDPIGVWVQAPGPGLGSRDRLPARPCRAPGGRRVGGEPAGQEPRPVAARGFLDYHQSTLSPYRGMRRVVVETDELRWSWKIGEGGVG